MAEPLGLPFWWTDRTQICRKVSSEQGVLKIVLKTKNDPFFLRRWINHHTKVAGSRNLLIFDNMSENDEVNRIYEEIRDEICVVKYDKFHNYIHSTEIFSDLYKALKISSDFFCFLDTDEFLTYVNADGVSSAAGLIEFLQVCREDVAVLPGSWIYNAPGSDQIFRAGTRLSLMQGLRWGKPLLNSLYDWTGIINHNNEVPGSYYNQETPTNVLVLHMANLDREQRIMANRMKLLARNFITLDDSLEYIVNIDTSGIVDGNIAIYISEIKELIASTHHVTTSLTRGSIRLRDGHVAEFYSDEERYLFLEFVSKVDNKYLQTSLMT